MQSDRELLEAAAKAAGYGVDIVSSREQDGTVSFYMKPEMLWWNPLTDDGDALRLAVKLEMIVDFSQDDGPLDVLPVFARGCVHDKTDPYSATRRSIVMCAAAMGEKA